MATWRWQSRKRKEVHDMVAMVYVPHGVSRATHEEVK
jgi:hypothetical protein